jgi:hypothetical protein
MACFEQNKLFWRKGEGGIRGERDGNRVKESKVVPVLKTNLALCHEVV